MKKRPLKQQHMNYGQQRDGATGTTEGRSPLPYTLPAMSREAREDWLRLSASLKKGA